MPHAAVTRWTDTEAPSPETLDGLLCASGLTPSWWSSAPGDRYTAHSHAYRKVLYCARGGIRFTIDDGGETIDLGPGDRLDLPPGTVHSALVSPEGVTCVEAAAR